MGIGERIEAVRERIRKAELRSGRGEGSVRLMGVSKFHPGEEVLEAIEAGLCLFGENRVQEACEKFPTILSDHSQAEVHLIGTLQRNKVRKIIPLVSCIQSVDRLELLEEIEKQSALLGITSSVLLEFHTGEESKAGFQDRDSLFRAMDRLGDLPHVRVEGLMTMAPFTDQEVPIRSSFRTLHTLREDCRKRWPDLDLPVLSMGMSSDFEIAIEEGSTLVRVGTAIFGGRT